MNRRSFITSLLTGIVAPAFLPGAGRVWKRSGELFVPDMDDWFQAQIELKSLRIPDTSLYTLMMTQPNPNWKPADPVNDDSWTAINWNKTNEP